MTNDELIKDSENFQRPNCGYVHAEVLPTEETPNEGACKLMLTGDPKIVEYIAFKLLKAIAGQRDIPFPALLAKMAVVDMAGGMFEESDEDSSDTLTIE